MLKSLTEDRRARFLRLRARCVEMSRIANAVRGETADASGAGHELRTPALDRLLWVFLKLLLSDQAIARFLQAADEKQVGIKTLADLADIKARIEKRRPAVPEAERDADRILRSLADSLATAQLRKDNLMKSKGNAEFVSTELDRLENKIAAVTEMAIGETDPDQMSSKIDAISEGISQTEATIRELQKITGMQADEATPSILDIGHLTVRRRTSARLMATMTDAKQEKTLAGTDGVSKATALPPHFPPWAGKLAELYFSGTTSMFVIHGNTFDVVHAAPEPDTRYVGLADFLAEQLFGRWDLVIHYDLARGLRCAAGSNSKRLQDMVTTANKWIGDLRQLPRDPTKGLLAIDLLVQKNVMADPDDRIRIAVLIDHAGYVAPSGDHLDLSEQTHLVTLLNWASSPYVKRLNMAFVLIDPRLSSVAERLTGNPHVASLEVPLPDADERTAFLTSQVAASGKTIADFSDYSIAELGKLTAGIGLTDLEVLVRSSLEGGRRLDRGYFRELKKRLIERQAQGMLEFVEPKWGLDTVVGHEAAKKRLLDDAELIKRGEHDTVPMGYLFNGPVGTGKSFLATCVAGSIGIPAVVLKNFRSKYVGETEGNLERVLGVMRSMGPVVVIVDEADAMLGDRDQGGDSGVGARIFGLIAAQMGDTRYRGKIVWMLLTARPDLLPIDLKRQGRAEVHIPLFYPTDDAELRVMLMTLAKKVGHVARRGRSAGGDPPQAGNLSGADIEGIIGRAYRTSLLAGSRAITKEALAHALANFMPSTQTLEREAQELAAIIECTDVEFLPPAKQDKLTQLGGREKLQERLTAIKQILEQQ